MLAPLRKPFTRFAPLLTLCLLVACFPFTRQEQETDSLPDKSVAPSLESMRISYQNPGMSADLGVGLWAWPLPMDYDQDGDLDLLVSCPDVPFNGIYFFENPDGSAFPTFLPPVKIGKGHKNIQVSYPNQEAQVMVGNMAFPDFINSQFENGEVVLEADSLEESHQKNRFKQWKWVDYEQDGDLDLIVGMDDWADYGWDNAYDKQGNWTNGLMHGYVYLLEADQGDFRPPVKIEADGQAIDVYGAPSPNFADFDGDGDLDLICGEFMDKMSWFENIGSRTEPSYAAGRFLKNEAGFVHMDLQMIIPTAIDWDRDGDVDLIVGDEDGRVAWIENSGQVKDGMPIFHSPRYFQQQADRVKFGALVTPVSVDWDGDGDEDLVCGNTAGYIGFIENLDGANPPRFANPTYLQAGGETIRILAGPNGSIQGPCEAKWGYTTLSVADWNGDELPDLLVNSIWGKVLWYQNIGTKEAPKLAAAQTVEVQWDGAAPAPEWNWWQPEADELATQWRTTPVAIDWNQDQLMDLVMLDHEGYLSWFERFEAEGKLLLKPGKRIFYDTHTAGYRSNHRVVDSLPGVLRLNSFPNGSSGRRKLCFTDWDGDGDLDLLLDSRSIHLMENVRSEDGNTYFTNRGPLLEQKLAGHSTSPTVVDWNRDGKPELLIGAEDGHFYYVPRNE